MSMKIAILQGSPHKNGSFNMLADRCVKGAKSIAAGQYWNGIHGRELGEASQDGEAYGK